MKLIRNIVFLFLFLIDCLTGAFVFELSYDFIVVGAGSAGSVIANRLTENSTWKVLLVEAGDKEYIFQDIPSIVQYLQLTSANWNDSTDPSTEYCMAMNNNQCSVPHGKVMGGSSVINYMIWTRGNPKDYDNWADLGNTGWNYNNVTKYFKKIERSTVVGRDLGYAGTDGPLPITFTPYRTDVADPFIQAGIAADGQKQLDYNGKEQLGYSWVQTNTKRGKRVSANRAYIKPIIGRRLNFVIKKNCRVAKVLIDEATKKVTGVTLSFAGLLYNVSVTKEVILSAGAINTPQILMLSGVGPKDHLASKGIDSIVDLKVGNYLQDHVAPGGVTILVNISTASNTSDFMNLALYLESGGGPLSSSGVEGISFHDTNPDVNKGWADMEFLQIGGALSGDTKLQSIFNIKPSTYETLFGDMVETEAHGSMIFPMIMRPKSTGYVKLKTNNYLDRPSIVPNYFSDPEDIRVGLFAIRKLQDIISQEPLQKIGASLLSIPCPGCESITFDTDDYWECYMRHMTFTIWHYSGTAKMGPSTNPDAVVSPTLKVHGITGLRVADASIMPEIPAAHLNAVCMMIGEKASDLIKLDYGSHVE